MMIHLQIPQIRWSPQLLNIQTWMQSFTTSSRWPLLKMEFEIDDLWMSTLTQNFEESVNFLPMLHIACSVKTKLTILSKS